MSEKPLRIAVSGYVGTGKTTFCIALAERLGIPVVAEGMGDILSAEAACHASMRGGQPRPGGAEAARKALLDSFADWAQGRRRTYDEHAAFVADRWEADLMVWWLTVFGGSGMPVDANTRALARDLQAKAATMTHVILMPFQKPFALPAQANADGLRRRVDFTTQALYETTLNGVLGLFARVRPLRLPPGAFSVEQRVEQAMRALAATPQ